MDVVVTPLPNVVMDSRTGDWCKLPYPNHPKGCPNYGKRPTCPPQAPCLEDIAKLPCTLVGVKFNLEEWANKLKEKHPNWSDRQARCCLYWQGKVRKKLKDECLKLCTTDDIILYTPEANGVHVFETCRLVDIELERNPKIHVWKIALVCRKS